MHVFLTKTSQLYQLHKGILIPPKANKNHSLFVGGTLSGRILSAADGK